MSHPGKQFRLGAAGLGLALVLAGCQTGPSGAPMSLKTDNSSAVSALQAINEAGHECWLASNDRDFRGLGLVPELDTSAGSPRILVVDKGKARGLPAMVIEASGDPVTVSTYGPLAVSATGARINRDIRRWTAGTPSCA